MYTINLLTHRKQQDNKIEAANNNLLTSKIGNEIYLKNGRI